MVNLRSFLLFLHTEGAGNKPPPHRGRIREANMKLDSGFTPEEVKQMLGTIADEYNEPTWALEYIAALEEEIAALKRENGELRANASGMRALLINSGYSEDDIASRFGEKDALLKAQEQE